MGCRIRTWLRSSSSARRPSRATSATSSPSSRLIRARKPSQLRFAKRSSTRAGFLVAAFALAAIVAVLGLAVGSWALTIVGLALAVALAGALAAYLLVTERRRHEAAEEELTTEARFLESLVDSMGRIAGSDDMLDCTRQEIGRASCRER